MSLRLSSTWLGVLLLLLGSASAKAQEPEEAIWTRVLALEASGSPTKGRPPKLDPRLAPFKKTLEKLPYAQIKLVREPRQPQVLQLKAGIPASWRLPKAYQAKLMCRRQGKPFLLSMHITRPPKPPQRDPEQVASMKVQLQDGAHYLVKCVKALPPGDMLLLVTVSKGRLKDVGP